MVGRGVVARQPGHADEGELPQLQQVRTPEEPLDRLAGHLGQVDLAGAEPREQLVGRQVDQFDLVGPLEHGVGNGLAEDRKSTRLNSSHRT